MQRRGKQNHFDANRNAVCSPCTNCELEQNQRATPVLTLTVHVKDLFPPLKMLSLAGSNLMWHKVHFWLLTCKKGNILHISRRPFLWIIHVMSILIANPSPYVGYFLCNVCNFIVFQSHFWLLLRRISNHIGEISRISVSIVHVKHVSRTKLAAKKKHFC